MWNELFDLLADQSEHGDGETRSEAIPHAEMLLDRCLNLLCFPGMWKML
jgi:hypothetical protein